jgi:serine phosphatase RsbU (regulator of sigma subunit)/anti-sigma regulatory factor (Ser/Thr protein kinase)/PAS domain-containing protein
MSSNTGQTIGRGSPLWAVRVAEIASWGTVLLLAAVVLTADLSSDDRTAGLVYAGAFGVWTLLLFRLLTRRLGNYVRLAWFALLVGMALTAGAHAVLRAEVPSAGLLYVPVIASIGLQGRALQAFVASALAVVSYWSVTAIGSGAPDLAETTFIVGLYLLVGALAGLVTREMRLHYRGERREHALATAVRHRLLAVVDAVDEGIIFSDRQGVVRVVNRRAEQLFQIDPDGPLGLPLVQLWRELARKTEDPEGFMETYQDARSAPDQEIRLEFEQIIPVRRQLRLYSGPALDDTGELVGRIEVFTDISEASRRAIEVERLYEEARSIAESYQRSVLPDEVPSLPFVSVVANYVAAAGRRAVCGDFYDFVPLRDGRVGYVLGDVVGIGPQAAGDAALTRYTLRSFAFEDPDPDPGVMLNRLNTYLHANLPPSRFVRVLYGVLDPERATFDYANAGHVPPVVFRSKSKEVEWLGEGGIALGVEDDVEYKVGHVQFEPGDMLVYYTDGVTEASRGGVPFGQTRFAELVEKYGVGTPGELVQAVRRGVEAWAADGGLRDDLALLVSQIVPDTLVDEPTRELVLPNEPSRLSEVRRFVAHYLADVRAPVDISSEIVLAVNEAAANAARYGRRHGGRSELRVRCALRGSTVEISVADDGGGFDASTVREQATLPDRYASGGRGLFLMHKLMDRVTFDPTPNGTVVNLTRAIPKLPR